jgi:hypothetical protein
MKARSSSGSAAKSLLKFYGRDMLEDFTLGSSWERQHLKFHEVTTFTDSHHGVSAIGYIGS